MKRASFRIIATGYGGTFAATCIANGGLGLGPVVATWLAGPLVVLGLAAVAREGSWLCPARRATDESGDLAAWDDDLGRERIAGTEEPARPRRASRLG